MDKVIAALLVGIFLLSSVSVVNAQDIPGSCVEGSCTCDGVNFFTCPCDANPCTTCAPGTPVYQEEGCAAGQNTVETTQPSEAASTAMPQISGNYAASFANELASSVSSIESMLQGIFGGSSSSKTAYGNQVTLPYSVSPSAPICSYGAIYGGDGQCHAECGDTGTYCAGGSQCVDGQCTCGTGEILGEDGQCHPECGSGTYCTGDTQCVDGQCVCDSGDVLGQDGACHPECGSGTYCTGTDVCDNGQCEAPNPCNSGDIMGEDGQCHAECGTSGTYCTGTSQCYNGQCLSCLAGYYLASNGYCYPQTSTSTTAPPTVSSAGSQVWNLTAGDQTATVILQPSNSNGTTYVGFSEISGSPGWWILDKAGDRVERMNIEGDVAYGSPGDSWNFVNFTSSGSSYQCTGSAAGTANGNFPDSNTVQGTESITCISPTGTIANGGVWSGSGPWSGKRVG